MAGDSGERLRISLAQVVASSLAAVSAAVVCSFFGVAGTVIGTAIASLFATAGSALYTYSLRRTRARLRELHRAGAASPPLSEVVKTIRQQGRHLFDRVEWAAIGIGVGAVFVLAIGIVTVIEDATNLNGGPLSSHQRSRHHHSVRHQGPPASSLTPTPSASPTASPSPSTPPTGTPSATPTGSPTATPTTTPTPSVTPTSTPSETPTDTPGSPSSTVSPN